MPSVTAAELLTRVYSRIDNNAALYPRDSVLEELNDSIRCVNLFTGVIQISVPIFTVGLDPTIPTSPQLMYPKPSGMVYITSVDYEGRSLSPTSLRALAGLYRSWATDISQPGRPVKEWVPIGITNFLIHPRD